MSKVTAVKEAVKESLIGVEEPAQASTQTKARFNQNAVKDATTGDLFLGEEEFINAVAPLTEDYVSIFTCGGAPVSEHANLYRATRSTRLNASSTAYSFVSPIARASGASPCPNGLRLRTS